MTLAQELTSSIESLAVLAVGTGLITATAALLIRGIGSTFWQRTIWRATLVGMVGLLAVEMTGVAPGVVQVCRAWVQPPEQDVSSKAVDIASVDSTTLALIEMPQAVGEDLPSTIQAVRTDCIPSVNIPAVNIPAVDHDVLHDPMNRIATNDLGEGFRPVPTGQTGTDPCQIEPSHTEEPVAAECDLIAENHVASEPSSATPSTGIVAWWLGLIWIVGTGLLLVKSLWFRLLLSRFRLQHTTHADGHLEACLDRLARRLRIGQCVTLLQSDRVATPVAFGFFRPTVVVPLGFSDQFGPREQEAMLAHELAHLASNDPAWQIIADAMVALLWWHPGVWWARRQLRATAEAAADEASLVVPDGPDLLAACLVTLGRRIGEPKRLAWLAIDGPGIRSGLGRRVERLLGLSESSRHVPRSGMLTAVWGVLPGLLIILAVFGTAWARPQATLNEGDSTMNVLSSSWRRSLAAAALMAFWAPMTDANAQDGEREKDRPHVERERDGDREEGERERDGDREEGKRERDGDREEGKRERDGDREEGKRERDGDREEGKRERDGDREEGKRERGGDRAEGDRERDGDREHAERREREHAEERELAERREREHAEKREHAERERDGDGELAIKRQLGELKQAYAKAKEAGQHDKAEALKVQAERILGEWNRHQAERKRGEHPDRPRPEVAEQLERKIRHLHAAAENLRAAGNGEMAEHLMHQVEQLKREFRVRETRPHRPMHPVQSPHQSVPSPPQRYVPDQSPPQSVRPPHRPTYPDQSPHRFGHPEHPDGPPPQAEHLQRQIHELREGMQNLNRQMEEIRKHLHRMAESKKD